MTQIRAMQAVATAIWRWRTWGQGLLLLLLLGGWQPAQARDGAVTQAAEQGLLWQVTSPAGKSSYLFGTIHSEDPRVTTLAPAVQQAFDRSSRYVMEIIPDQASMQAATQAMLLGQGDSLHALLGQPLYEKTVQALQFRSATAITNAASSAITWPASTSSTTPGSRISPSARCSPFPLTS